jgi:predicted Rossmann fold flavoprotein
VLGRYTPADFVALVERHRIPYHEKALGQLFCDGSARAIVAMLLAECAAASVELRVGCRVRDVSRAEVFRVETDGGTFTSGCLVLATGGLSIPKMGATGLSHDLARRFGLRLTAIRPGLVPLTFGDDLLDMMRPLAGVSLEAEAAFGRHRFREAMLFTHRGLSGPAVLQVSSYWRMGPVVVNLLPGEDAAAFLLDRKRSRPKAELRTVLAEVLPARFAFAMAEPGLRMADQPDRVLRALAGRLGGWEITPSGTEGYAKAEVTVGGVAGLGGTISSGPGRAGGARGRRFSHTSSVVSRSHWVRWRM